MCGKDPEFRINPLTYIVWFVIIFSGHTRFLLCSFLCAVLHESAHIAAYLSYGAYIPSVEIHPFGISATVGKSDSLTCEAESFCALCGPLMNLFLSAVFLFFSENRFVAGNYFIYCNLSFFVVNLLPVIPLDGGRVMYFMLLNKFGVVFASRLTRIVSFFIVFQVLAFGVYLFIASGHNISVILIGCYLCVYMLTSGECL